MTGMRGRNGNSFLSELYLLRYGCFNYNSVLTSRGQILHCGWSIVEVLNVAEWHYVRPLTAVVLNHHICICEYTIFTRVIALMN